jgi:hypothetical protein
MIDTWEDACKKYDETVAAWKKMQSQDLVAFNALLQKNNMESLQLTPTELNDPQCKFAPAAAAKMAKERVRK